MEGKSKRFDKEKIQTYSSNEKVKYFLMVPFEDDNFLNSYNDICSKLEKDNPKDFNKYLFQKPKKLHITLIVLDIKEDEKKKEKIINLINSLLKDIKSIVDNELIFNFEKFDVFDDIKKAHVLFAKMIEDENYYKLKMVTNLIIKNLVKENILSKKDLENLHVKEEYSDGELIYVLKYHITLLNVKYLNQALQKEGKQTQNNFDATEILKCIEKMSFPEFKMSKINLCAMREDEKNGTYELIHTFNIL